MTKASENSLQQLKSLTERIHDNDLLVDDLLNAFLGEGCGRQWFIFEHLDNHRGFQFSRGIKTPGILQSLQEVWQQLNAGVSVVQTGKYQVLPIFGRTGNRLAWFASICPNPIDPTSPDWKLVESGMRVWIQQKKRQWELEYNERANRALLRMSHQVSSPLPINELLEMTLDTLKTLILFDAAVVYMLERNEIISHQVQRGYQEESLKKLQLKVGQGIVGQCIKTGKSQLFSDVTTAPFYINAKSSTRSCIAAPLKFGRRIIGAFNLESSIPAHFKRRDLDLLEAFASHAAASLENARLYQEELKSREIQKDLQVASDIQKALLFHHVPKARNFQFSFFSQPCKVIGGDLYDIKTFRSGNISLMIGDVSGKGISGALLMANLIANFREEIRSRRLVNDIVSSINNTLVEITSPEKFASFFYGVIHVNDMVFFYTNAGHNPPILIRQNETKRELRMGGPILGFLPDIPYKRAKIKLRTGDVMLMYTDGLSEAMNEKGEQFGRNRLISFLLKSRRFSAETLKTRIIEEVRKFTGKADQNDDITFLIVKVR